MFINVVDQIDKWNYTQWTSLCIVRRVFFLVRIFKLNLESRGMFTELSYLNIILTIINIIMFSVRRMLYSNTSASETI